MTTQNLLCIAGGCIIGITGFILINRLSCSSICNEKKSENNKRRSNEGGKSGNYFGY